MIAGQHEAAPGLPRDRDRGMRALDALQPPEEDERRVGFDRGRQRVTIHVNRVVQRVPASAARGDSSRPPRHPRPSARTGADAD